MRNVLFLCAIATAIAVNAENPKIVMGTAVSSADHSIVVGEAIGGSIGSANSDHATHGQLQGLVEVQPNLSSSISTGTDTGLVKVSSDGSQINIIITAEGIYSVVLTDLSGHIMQSTKALAGTTVLDLRSNIAGVYLLAITGESSTFNESYKIIKH